MKRFLSVLFVIALSGCMHRPTSSEMSTRDIEQLSFSDAYSLWRQERESLAKGCSPNGSYSTPTGVTDPQTGRFTPSTISALTCRLGREAHVHESFLRKELTENADVHMVLESSPRLCERYGIASKAQVLFVPGRGYVHRTTDGWSPEVQQRVWLEAMDKTASQQTPEGDGPRPAP